MTYEELIAAIKSSVKEDWLHDVDWGEVWTYKRDLNVRIERVESGGVGEQLSG